VDISEFITRLRLALIDRDVSEDAADEYVKRLETFLDPDDVRNATDADIDESVNIYLQSLDTVSADDTESSDTEPEVIVGDIKAPETAIADEPLSSLFESDEDINSKTNIFTSPIHEDVHVSSQESSPADQSPNDPGEDINLGNYGLSEAEDSVEEETKATPRGTAMFILITVLTSPLWLVAAALFALPFIAMFISEFAITAALVCALAGFAALGAAASLTGIIYGIVKVFSEAAVGIYEIGFGVIIAGVTMICCILIYNGAVRFMPWLIKKTKKFFKFLCSKIKPLLKAYKRRCENL